jgi:hypothetical protein
MTSGVQSIAQGIVDSFSTPATAKVPANFRVTASGQPIGVVGDVITFNGLPTASGSWVIGSFRVSINSLPVINQTVQGVSVLSIGSPGGPIVVQTPDFRVKAS